MEVIMISWISLDLSSHTGSALNVLQERENS